jgi:hypothetical protein
MSGYIIIKKDLPASITTVKFDFGITNGADVVATGSMTAAARDEGSAYTPYYGASSASAVFLVSAITGTMTAKAMGG